MLVLTTVGNLDVWGQLRVFVARWDRIEELSATPAPWMYAVTKNGLRDPYLYLLAEDGTLITGSDDGGAGLDARVERDLLPGVYMIEATTVGGRRRGPADFAVSVSYVSGYVRVDGARYTVATGADSDGEVTTEVKSATDPAEEGDAEVRLRAIYAAGVRTQLLDGLFERPEIAKLSEEAHPNEVTVADLSTDTLRAAFAERYASVVGASGMIDSLEAGEALNPITIEESVLQVADAASSEFAWIASSWRSLLRRSENGAALSFEDALEAHSQVAYAESVVAPGPPKRDGGIPAFGR